MAHLWSRDDHHRYRSPKWPPLAHNRSHCGNSWAIRGRSMTMTRPQKRGGSFVGRECPRLTHAPNGTRSARNRDRGAAKTVRAEPAAHPPLAGRTRWDVGKCALTTTCSRPGTQGTFHTRSSNSPTVERFTYGMTLVSLPPSSTSHPAQPAERQRGRAGPSRAKVPARTLVVMRSHTRPDARDRSLLPRRGQA